MTYPSQTEVTEHLKLCLQVWRMMQWRLSVLWFLLHVNEKRKGDSKVRNSAAQHKVLGPEYCGMLCRGKNWHLECWHTEFDNHRLETRAVVPLFHDWFVSFGGESLYRLPMISKVHLLGLKWNEMRSHSSKYRIYPFTREGMGVFRDLANTKDV